MVALTLHPLVFNSCRPLFINYGEEEPDSLEIKRDRIGDMARTACGILSLGPPIRY